jgi:hypothetical protein
VAELLVQRARDAGALVQLQFAANELAVNEMLAGRLTDAAALVEEDRMVFDITGNPPVGYAAMLLAALRGTDAASRQITEARDQTLALGEGRIVSFAKPAIAKVADRDENREEVATHVGEQVLVSQWIVLVKALDEYTAVDEFVEPVRQGVASDA